MIVRSTGNNLIPFAQEGIAHGLRIGDDLLLIGDKFRLESFEKGYGLGGNDMLQRAALYTGEYAGIKNGAHLLHLALRSGQAPGIVEVLAHQDHAATRATEGLVGGRSDDMGIFDRILQQAGGDKAGGMSHVDPQECAHLVGDGTHPLVIPLTGIGRSSADDQFRLAEQGRLLHFVIVNAARVRIQTIGHGVV